MALEEARNYLVNKGYGKRIRIFDVSSATVELAAIAVGTEPARIAKSLTFMVEDHPIMIICAGDAKVNNADCSPWLKPGGSKAAWHSTSEDTQTSILAWSL